MIDELHPTKTLGLLSAKFIAELLSRSKNIFTLEDASSIYGKGRSATAKFLSDLIKRGILARIKSGVYLILQMGHESTQINNWPVIARELSGSDDYFISHYSAMRLHGMTTHASNEVYITLRKRRGSKKIGHVIYNFVYTKPNHFWGSNDYWVTKQDKVFVSDIERTLLDGLERPELCGGMKEIVRAVWVKQNYINWMKIIEYTKNFRTKAAVKRLGLILEILHLGAEHLPLLANSIASAKDYILLDPHGPKKGTYLRRWHIRLNMDIEELKASVWG